MKAMAAAIIGRHFRGEFGLLFFHWRLDKGYTDSHAGSTGVLDGRPLLPI